MAFKTLTAWALFACVLLLCAPSAGWSYSCGFPGWEYEHLTVYLQIPNDAPAEVLAAIGLEQNGSNKIYENPLTLNMQGGIFTIADPAFRPVVPLSVSSGPLNPEGKAVEADTGLAVTLNHLQCEAYDKRSVTVNRINYYLTGSAASAVTSFSLCRDDQCDGCDTQDIVATQSSADFTGLSNTIAAGGQTCFALLVETDGSAEQCGRILASTDPLMMSAETAEGTAEIAGATVEGSVIFDGMADACQDNDYKTKACTPCSKSAGEPVQSATGEFYTEALVDLDLGGPLPLRFSRSYAARLTADIGIASRLGKNWMHKFDIRLSTVSGTRLDVIYDQGKLISFSKSASGWQLSRAQEIAFQLGEASSGDYFMLDPVKNLVFGFAGTGAAAGRLISIQDRSGNTISLTYDDSGSLISAAA
ncbi:DUF6531 domain-containing protein [Thermodesulfobacteriota bacterium]